MKEIEVKILEIDQKKIERLLRNLKAEKIFDGPVSTIFYDFPNHSIQKRKDLLRLRKKGSTTVFTYKVATKKSKAKVMDEYEVVVDDFSTMQQILANLGLSPQLTVHKKRTSYLLGSTHVDIDCHCDAFSFIPPFLEIEASDIKTVYTMVKTLGFHPKQCRPWSFLDVWKYYEKKQKKKSSSIK